jgi:hypothetical protein
MKKLLFSAALLVSAFSFAQVGVGTTTPDASAQLDVTSTSKGLLPPRMTMVQMNNIATPANGLIVYCSDCATVGIHTYISPSWSAIYSGSINMSSLVSEANEMVTEINIENEITAGAGSSIFTDGAPGARDNNEKRLKYTNLTGTSPNKINWYFFAPSSSLSVSQLKSIYYIASKTGKRAPYIFVYTKPTGTGDLASWYKSRFTYERASSTSELGFNQFYAILKSDVEYGLKGLVLNKNFGGQDQVTGNELNENILYIGIGTDSAAQSGDYNFSLQEIGIEKVSGSREIIKFTTK